MKLSDIQSASLKRRIMRRVYTTWLLKNVMPVFVAEIVVFSIIFIGIQSYMSFGHVMNNAFDRAFHYSPMSFGRYIYASFYEAELVVTLMFLAVLAFGATIIRDSFRISRNLGRNFF